MQQLPHPPKKKCIPAKLEMYFFFLLWSFLIHLYECFSNWKRYLSASSWSESVKGDGTIDLSGLMDLHYSWDICPRFGKAEARCRPRPYKHKHRYDQ